MKYLGSLGELKETMQEAHGALTQLHGFADALLRAKNSGGLGSLGGPGSSSDPAFGAPTVADVTPMPDGSTKTVYDNGNVSIFNPTTGQTITTTAAGGSQTINSAGAVIGSTGNPMNATAQAGNKAAAAIAQPIETMAAGAANAVSNAGAGLTGLLDGVTNMFKSAGGLLIAGAIVYVLFKDRD